MMVLDKDKGPEEDGVRISFKDRHFKDVSKDKAELVRIEYFKGKSRRWAGNAVVYKQEPIERDYTSGSLDCVMVGCQTRGCPWKGRAASIHIYLDDVNKFI